MFRGKNSEPLNCVCFHGKKNKQWERKASVPSSNPVCIVVCILLQSRETSIVFTSSTSSMISTCWSRLDTSKASLHKANESSLPLHSEHCAPPQGSVLRTDTHLLLIQLAAVSRISAYAEGLIPSILILVSKEFLAFE